ncbi:hypothetical protein F7725_022796 [Dissostichus mawsoni]|uniref:Uncharacterized protein n=1 Tax=Dissostichus mawsoni TaxID=36200 RepID=A0A7J5Z0W2_DISMA|nr:hypothetical protein F7725_022796 [Dissostichus mawsoni]
MDYSFEDYMVNLPNTEAQRPRDLERTAVRLHAGYHSTPLRLSRENHAGEKLLCLPQGSTSEMWRMRTGLGAEWMLIALYRLPCALHPSAIRQTRTGDIRGAFGEDRETDLLSMKVQFPSLSREYRASVFDIVTVEVEGWEEMSEGGTERRTDGNSGDVSDDMAFADSSSCEEDEEEEDPAMFSSKFLSGANPLNAVSSAVNKFGLFGDDGEGDKNKKGPSQQGVKPPGEQQPGAGPGKGPQQQHGPQKSDQGPPMQTGQPLPKQGSPQLHGNGQTAPQNKPGGQKVTQKAGTQPEGHLKGQSQKDLPKGPPQQGSLKPGGQPQIVNKSGVQPGSPKASSQQQVPPKTGMQKQGPSKTGAQQQQPAKTGLQESTKAGSQQGSPKVGQQPQGSPRIGQQQQQQQGSPKLPQQQQGSPKGREWLCLTCQVKRAQGFSEPQGPSMKKPIPNKVSAAQNQTPSPAAPVKKEMSGAGSPQKMQSTSAKVQAKGEAAKGSDIQKQASPASVHKMTPETQRTSGPQQPDQISQTGRKQSSAKQESGGLFGFGGAKTEAAKPEESVSGKMFGFGSSIFSSASTLIASAVQDESKTTPPVSPKMQSTKETKPAAVQKSGKEWLCLNCQVKRAQEGPGQPSLQKTAAPDKTEAAKRPASTAPGQKTPQDSRKAVPQKQPDQTSQMSEKKGNATISTQQESGGFFGFGGPKSQPDAAQPAVTGKMMGFGSSIFNSASTLITSAVQEWLCLNCQMLRALGAAEPPGTPMMKLQPSPNKVPASAINKATPQLVKPQKKDTQTPTESKIKNTSAPGSPQRKPPIAAEQPATAKVVKLPESQKQVSPSPGQKTTTTTSQEESGKLFGFGSPKAQPDSAKPAESLGGKMFGFGTSIFSSTSDSKTTPLVSPKMPRAEAPKSPLAHKQGQEVKHWLCLNCQMQRALSASELTGPPMKSADSISPSAGHQKIKASNQVETRKKSDAPSKIQNQGLDTLQEKGSPKPGSLLKAQAAAVTKETKAAKGPDLDPKASPTPVQKAPLGIAGDSQKPTDKISEPGLNPTKITPDTKGELGNLSGPKTGPDASKTTESVTGKMFGFGSSIFSSASTLVSSAVQEVSSTTPPGSRKMSAGPKISPRSTPTASPKMSPARDPKTLRKRVAMS